MVLGWVPHAMSLEGCCVPLAIDRHRQGNTFTDLHAVPRRHRTFIKLYIPCAKLQLNPREALPARVGALTRVGQVAPCLKQHQGLRSSGPIHRNGRI